MSGNETSGSDERDARLMQRIRDTQDESALRELIKLYQGPVYTMAYRMLGNAADAEDITQRTFIRVWKAAPDYEPQARFSTWLFTIMKRLVFNETRRRKRKPVSSLDARETPPQPIADHLTEHAPDARMQHKELKEIIERALNQLSPKARMAIQLRRFEDMAYEDISTVLNMSLPATKSLIFRARQQLRELLADYL